MEGYICRKMKKIGQYELNVNTDKFYMFKLYIILQDNTITLDAY